LGKGIQVKANGTGYVIAPPSIHPSGGSYKWDGKFDVSKVIDWPKEVMPNAESLRTSEDVKPGATSGDNTLLTKHQLEETLSRIKSDDYNDWIAVGQALKRDYEDGFDIWVAWSRKSPKFKSDRDCKAKWASFNRNDRGTGTLVYMSGGHVPKPSAEEEFASTGEKPKTSGLIVTELSEKQEKSIEWLVPGYFAKGMLHCIAGFGGDGKSSVMSAIIAAATKGIHILDGTPLPGGPMEVLIATEEPVEQQTLPRLKLAGADISKIKMLEGVREKGQVVPWNLADHIDKARAHFQANPQLQLFEIDPIGNYMEGRRRKREMNSWNDTDVRAILGPWQKLAEELNICIVFLAHFNKGKATRAVEKVMGSAAFTTTTRFTYLVGKPGPDYLEGYGYSRNQLGEDRVLLSIKRNIGRDPFPIVFGVETHNGDEDGNPLVTVKGKLPRGTGGDIEELIMGGVIREGGPDRNVDRVLAAIKAQEGITRRELSKQTGISEENVSKHLRELGDQITKVRNGQEVWIFCNDSPLLTIFT
jgi:hypothetical protein